MSWLGIDWSQLWYPGPRRPFSAEEMARAGNDPPSPTVVMVAVANVLAVALALAVFAPAGQLGRLAAAGAIIVAVGTVGSRWLWWRPWRRPLLLACLAVLALMLSLAFLARWMWPDRADREALAMVVASFGAALPILFWFVVIFRAHQIEARLREQAEREKAIEMARRLASAQIEPHFLFNTLASLQHWVHTKDDRAAPLLAALTGYLRATLPLFNRPQLEFAQELAAVERYLQVMQLRMGARLAWRIDVPEPLRAALLPPGLLLTLVENAVQHGLEPHIAGGTVRVAATVEAGKLTVEVSDTGIGPPALVADGVGLANLRQRLLLAHGDRASFTLGAATGGGGVARLQLPLQTAVEPT
jgi:Histidine kinase